MNIEPIEPYVYQPLPPQDDGKFYGAAGQGFSVRGLTKQDAERLVADCKADPKSTGRLVNTVDHLIANEWSPKCGCRFESIFSNAVLLCEKCSKDPGHNE